MMRERWCWCRPINDIYDNEMRWGVLLNSTWPSALITSPIWLTGILPSPRWSYSRNASWRVSIDCHSSSINQQIFAVWFEVSLAYLELGNLIFVELWSHLSFSRSVWKSLQCSSILSIAKLGRRLLNTVAGQTKVLIEANEKYNGYNWKS